MENFRIYRLLNNGNLNNNWEKTSYVGDFKLMQKICKSLSKSKYHKYEIVID